MGLLCHKPTAITDKNGKTTTYSYDNLGNVTEIKSPSINGVSYTKQISYVDKAIYYFDAATSSVKQLTPLLRLPSVESSCNTSSNCAGTSDELRVTYGYPTEFVVGGTENNGTILSRTTSTGDGTILQVVTYAHDAVGNVVSMKTQRNDFDDTSYYTYDGMRRKIFEIGADPDGSGPLPRLIVHHVYDLDGNEIRTESGTGFANDGSDFSVVRFRRMTFDPITGRLASAEEVVP